MNKKQQIDTSGGGRLSEETIFERASRERNLENARSKGPATRSRAPAGHWLRLRAATSASFRAPPAGFEEIVEEAAQEEEEEEVGEAVRSARRGANGPEWKIAAVAVADSPAASCPKSEVCPKPARGESAARGWALGHAKQFSALN